MMAHGELPSSSPMVQSSTTTSRIPPYVADPRQTFRLKIVVLSAVERGRRAANNNNNNGVRQTVRRLLQTDSGRQSTFEDHGSQGSTRASSRRGFRVNGVSRTLQIWMFCEGISMWLQAPIIRGAQVRKSHTAVVALGNRPEMVKIKPESRVPPPPTHPPPTTHQSTNPPPTAPTTTNGQHSSPSQEYRARAGYCLGYCS